MAHPKQKHGTYIANSEDIEHTRQRHGERMVGDGQHHGKYRSRHAKPEAWQSHGKYIANTWQTHGKAFAMSLSCICNVFAMCVAMYLSCVCHVFAMSLPGLCHVTVYMLCIRHVFAMCMPYICNVAAHVVAFAMSLPCLPRVHALALC
jgi:hypothetical protein